MSRSIVKFVSAALLAAATLAGCGHNNDAQNALLGRWVGGEKGGIVLQIERNDGSYLVRETRPRFVDDKIARTTVALAATVIEGGLEIPDEVGVRRLTIDHKTGLLTDGEHEYTRQK